MASLMIDGQIWADLLKIAFVNILLSGDNAVVIAVSCRALPDRQKKKAIFWGTAIAVMLRIILTSVAALLLHIAYLKLVGSLLLVWIAVKFLLPEDESHGGRQDSSEFISALRTIIIADLVMSLDNVVGVAAAAEGRLGLLIVGLLTSMPLVIYGSTLMLKILARFPVFVVLGAALLGYIGGEMAMAEEMVATWLGNHSSLMSSFIPFFFAVFVVAVGKSMAKGRLRNAPSVSEKSQEIELVERLELKKLL